MFPDHRWLCGLLLFAPLVAPASENAIGFQQACGASQPAIAQAQVHWHCIERGHLSFADIESGLTRDNPRSAWGPPGARSVLRAIEQAEHFWDCKPDPQRDCGWWLRFTPTRYVFVQQLFADNVWSGIGITTFCAAADECSELEGSAAQLLPKDIDLSESELGVPPIAPPLPPPPYGPADARQ